MNQEMIEFERLFRTQPNTFFCRLIDESVDALMTIQERLEEHIETGDFETFKVDIECRQMFREDLSVYEQKLFGGEIH